MALVSGVRLGHYEILAPLGAGGMGEVYRARDTRLGREVAIKVLPTEKLSDPARRARFVEEARAASSLNHPGIVTIHEIEWAEGLDFIVMELVPGKTLDALIPRQGMRLGEALRLAIPLADALAAAHAAGVVHRDFKPANVMVTPEGVPKILDFGLAKLTQGEEVGRDSTTLDAPARISDPGAVAGTPAYMSPEQASGTAVDARSDIFAFGAVLYEMVTGRRPFAGGSSAEVVAALLKDQPAPPSQHVPDVPKELERIILRCLRKEPGRRFQHMTDLSVELREVKEESDSQAAAPGVASVRNRRRRAWAAVAAATILLGVAAAGLLWFRGRSAKPAGPPQMRRVTSDSGLTTDPALSPDGKLLAYASDRATGQNLDIWLQHLGGGEPVRLTSWDSDEREPDFSPDGSRIAFRSSRDGGGIYVTPVLGGEPALVAPKGFRPRFSPDGNSIAYWVGAEGGRVLGVFVVSVFGGEPRRIAADLFGHHPAWSPDGKRLLMNGWKSRPGSEVAAESDWWVASLDGGPARSAGFADALRRQGLRRFETDPGVWTRDGGWIVFAGSTGDSSNLYRVRVSSQSRIVGDAERITFGTGIETKPALSANGQLVLATEVFTSHLWSVPADTNRGQVTGPMTQLTRDATEDMWPQISEDGRRVAYFSVSFGRGGVLVRDSEARAPKQLAPGWDVDLYVALVRGGTRVVFSGEAASGEKGVYALDIGSGVPALLKKDAVSWGASEDGRYFLEYSLETETGLVAFDTETRREFRMASHESSRVLSPHFSRDGRWVVLHVANSELTRQVFVLPFHEGRETPRGEWIPITDGLQLDRDPKWSPDGNLGYFLADREGARGIYAQKLDPATKHPVGRPFEVMMFRGTQRNMMFPNSGQSSPAVARDKLVFPLREVQGNIWLTQMP